MAAPYNPVNNDGCHVLFHGSQGVWGGGGMQGLISFKAVDSADLLPRSRSPKQARTN